MVRIHARQPAYTERLTTNYPKIVIRGFLTFAVQLTHVSVNEPVPRIAVKKPNWCTATPAMDELPNPAPIVINKLDSARRQLITAIRIYFTNGDEVSTHTLTAAA